MTCICPKSNMDQANTIIYQLMMFQVKWSPKPEKNPKTWYFKKFDYGTLKIQPVKNKDMHCLGLATFTIKDCSWNNSLVPLHVLDSHKNMQYSLIFSKIGLVTHYAIKDCLDQHFALPKIGAIIFYSPDILPKDQMCPVHLWTYEFGSIWYQISR